MRLFEIENKTPSFKILSMVESQSYRNLVEKYEDLPLYSGVDIHLPNHHPLQLVLCDSRNTQRVSKTGDNTFNRILEELPSWHGYPKRSRSMFCTTNKSYATGFASKVFRVIPLEVSNFVICPSNDNQYSFDDLFEVEGPFRSMNMPMGFSKLLTIFFRALKIPENSSILKRLKDLQTVCKADSYDKIYDKIYDSSIGWFSAGARDELFNVLSSDVNIIDFLNDYLSPERNGFILTNDITKIKNVKSSSYRGNEVFFSGSALFHLISDENKRYDFEDFDSEDEKKPYTNS